MREPQPKAIHLKDYAPPAFRVETVDLDVDIRDDHALVRAKLAVRRNAGSGPLVLDGDELELLGCETRTGEAPLQRRRRQAHHRGRARRVHAGDA